MKRLHRKKSFVIKLTIVIFLIIFLMYYFFVVSPIIKTYTSAETQAVTEEAINRAVSNVINQSLKYDSLIDISYTASGDIASFTANQFEINSISREIVERLEATKPASIGAMRRMTGITPASVTAVIGYLKKKK